MTSTTEIMAQVTGSPDAPPGASRQMENTISHIVEGGLTLISAKNSFTTSAAIQTTGIVALPEDGGSGSNMGPHWVGNVFVDPTNRVLSSELKGLQNGEGYLADRKRKDAATIAGYWINKCIMNDKDDGALQHLDEFLRKLWKPRSSKFVFTLTEVYARELLQLCLLKGKLALLDLILANSNNTPVPIEFLGWVKTNLNTTGISWEGLQKAAVHCVLSQPTLTQRYEAVRELTEPTEDNERLEHILGQAVDRTLETFHSNPTLDGEDGAALFEILLYYRNFKTLEEMRDQTTFLFGFLKALRQGMGRGEVAGTELYKHLSSITIQSMQFSTFAAGKPPERSRNLPAPQFVPIEHHDHSPLINYVDPQAVAVFLSSLFERRLEEHASKFARTFDYELISLTKEQLHSLWIPVFQDLAGLLGQQEAPLLMTPQWQQTFWHMLRKYATEFVGSRPILNLSFPTVPCTCTDCRRLNRFLKDKEKLVEQFPMSTSCGEHVRYMLNFHGIDCTHQWVRRFLVVRKRTTRHEVALGQWAKRRAIAMQQVRAFDQDKLRLLLGVQYERIINMDFLESPAPVNQNASTAMGSRRTPSSAATTSATHRHKRPRTALEPMSDNPTLAQLETPEADTAALEAENTALDAEIAALEAVLAGYAGSTAPGGAKPSSSSRAAPKPPLAIDPPRAGRSAPSQRERRTASSSNYSRDVNGGLGPRPIVGVPPHTTAPVSRATATTGRYSGRTAAAVIPRRPTTTTTMTLAGNKRKIVEVIDLTED